MNLGDFPRTLPPFRTLELPSALQFYLPIVKEKYIGGKLGISIPPELHPATQRKECALERTKSETLSGTRTTSEDHNQLHGT